MTVGAFCCAEFITSLFSHISPTTDPFPKACANKIIAKNDLPIKLTWFEFYIPIITNAPQ